MQANKWADLATKFPAGGRDTGSSEEVKDVADGIVLELYKGGKEAIVGVVAALPGPDQSTDSKLRHAIHALVTHVASMKDPAAARTTAEALASTLGGDRPKEAQAFVAGQLQRIGGQEVVPALGKLLDDDDLCEPATQALVRIGESAAVPLRKALPAATGARVVTIAQALGVLRDRASVPALQKLCTHADREARLTAVWALANIGDEGSVPLVLKASQSEGYERIKATSACLLLAENLRAGGKKKEAEQIYRGLQQSHTEANERHIQQAVEQGLKALGAG